MAGESVHALDFTGGRFSVALSRASMGFHFWH